MSIIDRKLRKMGYPALQVTEYSLTDTATGSPVRLLIVQRYIEGVPESTQLVDLLSAGSNSIEPTAAAGRPPLYPEVSSCQSRFLSYN